MQDTDPSSEYSTASAAPCEEWNACVEKTVREEPLKAIGAAFAAGILLTIFPVGRLMGGLVRLAFGLVRPVLVVLGVVKLAEEIEKRNKL